MARIEVHTDVRLRSQQCTTLSRPFALKPKVGVQPPLSPKQIQTEPIPNLNRAYVTGSTEFTDDVYQAQHSLPGLR